VLDRLLPPLAIPMTLRSLSAPLDRLGSARMVAQIGAAIGRQFSYALIRAVSRLPEDELPADGTKLLERVGAWLEQRARMKPAGKSFLVSEQHTCLARSLCSPHSAQMDIFVPVYSPEPSNYSFKRSEDYCRG